VGSTQITVFSALFYSSSIQTPQMAAREYLNHGIFCTSLLL